MLNTDTWGEPLLIFYSSLGCDFYFFASRGGIKPLSLLHPLLIFKVIEMLVNFHENKLHQLYLHKIVQRLWGKKYRYYIYLLMKSTWFIHIFFKTIILLLIILLFKYQYRRDCSYDISTFHIKSIGFIDN